MNLLTKMRGNFYVTPHGDLGRIKYMYTVNMQDRTCLI
jgi:hypothetical protein